MKGLKRRKQYECSGCLQPMYEFPALVVDKSAMRCPDCQRKDDPGMTDSQYVKLKLYYAPPGQSGKAFRASLKLKNKLGD